MMGLRKVVLVACGLGLSACSTVDVATRNNPYEVLPAGQPQTPSGYIQNEAPADLKLVPAFAEAGAVPEPSVQITDAFQVPVSIVSVRVRVPRSLSVSEANRYLPRGDIVWREDPIGDRHAQVGTIVQAAMEQGTASLDGPVQAVLDIRLSRFHALTEKARYTTGGVHSISFDLALTDPQTGELLTPVRQVRADLDAFGGKQALRAMAAGQTQKVRITNHLAEVIRQELTNPDGYKNASLGFMQMLNNI